MVRDEPVVHAEIQPFVGIKFHCSNDIYSTFEKLTSLPVETFRMIAEKAFPHLTLVVPTLSGEPFVLPYWDEMIENVEKYGCKLDLTTNGMLMRGERLRKVLPHLSNLVISLDGATKETFEYVRTGADFDVVMENLAELTALRREMGLGDELTVSFNVTLLRENIAELPQIIEIAAAHDVKLVTGAFMIVFDQKLVGSSPLNNPEVTFETDEWGGRTAHVQLREGVKSPGALPLDADWTVYVDMVTDCLPMGIHVSAPVGGADLCAMLRVLLRECRGLTHARLRVVLRGLHQAMEGLAIPAAS